MAIASYITIDNKRYRVLVEANERDAIPPKTVRSGVLGNTIISAGPGNPDEIMRFVLAIDYSPATEYGTVADLMTSANKTSVSYTDHITSESTVWGSGTFNITILMAKRLMLPQAVMPSTGFLVQVEAQKVLS